MSVDLFTPQQITGEERLKLDNEFLALLGDVQKEEELMETLQTFFSSSNVSNDSLYYADYLRWYAFLCWKNLNTLDKSILVNIVFPRLVIVGLLQDIDVWKSLIWYLQTRSLDEADMQTIYRTIQESFFASNQSLGKEKGVDISLSEILKTAKILQTSGVDSIIRAEFYSRIQRLLFSNVDMLPFIPIEKEVVMDRLLGLINFFLGVEPLKIFYIVEAYINPEDLEINEELLENSEVTEIFDIEDQKNLNFDSIPSLVDAKFEKDENGQYQDIEGVFAYLDELATERGDDSIREMFYFDETSGGFIWKE